jgi:hypothetical protein
MLHSPDYFSPLQITSIIFDTGFRIFITPDIADAIRFTISRHFHIIFIFR